MNKKGWKKLQKIFPRSFFHDKLTNCEWLRKKWMDRFFSPNASELGSRGQQTLKDIQCHSMNCVIVIIALHSENQNIISYSLQTAPEHRSSQKETYSKHPFSRAKKHVSFMVRVKISNVIRSSPRYFCFTFAAPAFFGPSIMAGQHTPMKGTPMTNKAFITGY